MRKELKLFIEKIKEFLAKKFKQYDSKIPYIIITCISLLIVIFGINLFIELTENIKSNMVANFDAAVTNYVVSFRASALTDYFIAVTHIGDVWGYLVIYISCSVLFYLLFKNWKYVIQISLVLLLALSSNLLLKAIINRARPSQEHLVTVETLSYPSGHAMTAMAFYGFLIYLISTFRIHIFSKISIISLLLIFIISVGISRVYLGVHYPSDVVGGFIAGFVWVIFCVLILNLLKVFKEDPTT